jgi:hypothetical protein
MPANVVTQPSRADGNCSDAAGPRSGSTEQDTFWDDLLESLASALRDVERVKVQIANDVTLEFERIRSAFNCQNVGHETLSAEQIYVDHAIEQAKGALAACGAPDAADLSSQEVIIGEDCASDAQRRIPVTQEEPAAEELIGLPIAAHKLGAEKLAPIDVNLLDLSEDIAAPETTTGGLTETERTAGVPTKEASEGMSDIDLLDFAEPTSAPTSVNEVNAKSLTTDEGMQKSLLHISESTASKKAEEGALDPSRTRIDMDLFDLAPLPTVSTAQPLAQV